LFGVRAELVVETEICRSRDWVDARVGGPHAGEALRDGAKVVLHCSRSDLVVAVVAGQRAGTDPVGKDLKDWDFVGDSRQEGVLLDGDAKPTPDSPVGAGGGGSARNDTGLDRFFSKAEVNTEFMAVRRWQSRQDSTCG